MPRVLENNEYAGNKKTPENRGLLPVYIKQA